MWIVVLGYIVGRLLEGVFILSFKMEMFTWRPFDGWFRQVIARRNPNLLLLTAGVALGPPGRRPRRRGRLDARQHRDPDRAHRAGGGRTRGRPGDPALVRGTGGGRLSARGAIAALALALVLAPPLLARAGGDDGSAGGAQPDPALRTEPTPEPVLAPAPDAAGPGEVEPAAPSGPPPDPTLRIPGDGGSDSYQLSALLDDGSQLLARILITNAGPGDRNAIATGLWIERDGTVHSFDNVRRSNEWQLADDRKRFDIGSTHLDLSGDHARYWITKKRIQVDVQLPLRDGRPFPDGFEAKSANADLLATLVPVVGTIKLRERDTAHDVRGVASLVHGWSKRADFGGARRVSATFREAERRNESLLLLQQQVPGGAARALAIWRDAEGRLHTLEALQVRAEGRLPGDRPSSYPAPAVLRIDGALTGSVALREVLWERDLIGSLPLALRTVMGFALDARPRRVVGESGDRGYAAPRLWRDPPLVPG